MSKKWNFAAPMVQGVAPRQAHANIPDGLWEREMGRDAFFGPATDFYHRNPPNAWSVIDKNGPRPHVFDTRHIVHITRSPWHAAEMLVNDSIRIRYWKTSGSMDHLVKLVVYLTDVRHREPVYRTMGEYIKGVHPVCTGLTVVALARPDWLVEIDATAVIPD